MRVVEPPITFIEELKNVKVEEGNGIALRCELSRPGAPVEWRRGLDLLANGERYQMKQKDAALELLIRRSLPDDSGVYTCMCAGAKTIATVVVTGERALWLTRRNLPWRCVFSMFGTLS